MNLFDKIIYDLFLKENGSEKTEAETKETNSNKSQIETLINYKAHKKNKGYVIFISATIAFLTISMFAIIYSMFVFNDAHTYKPVNLFDDYIFSSNNPYISNYTLNGVEHTFRVKVGHSAYKYQNNYFVDLSAFLYLDDNLIIGNNPAFNGFISNYHSKQVDRYDKNEFNNKNFEYTYVVNINVLKDLSGKEYAIIRFISKSANSYGLLYLLVINENNELIYNTIGAGKVYRGLEKNEDNAFGNEGFIEIENNNIRYVSEFDGNLAHVTELTIDNNIVQKRETETFTAILG